MQKNRDLNQKFRTLTRLRTALKLALMLVYYDLVADQHADTRPFANWLSREEGIETFVVSIQVSLRHHLRSSDKVALCLLNQPLQVHYQVDRLGACSHC